MLACKGVTMEATKYEVGKFYLFPVMAGFTVKMIPAQVVRKLKRKIVFKFLRKGIDGRITFDTDYRYYRYQEHCKAESAGVSNADIYSIIPTAWSDKVAPKPELWDKVEAAEKKGAR